MEKEQPHIKLLCVYQGEDLLLLQTHPSSSALQPDLTRESQSALLQSRRLQLLPLETQRINSLSGQWNVLRGSEEDLYFLVLASSPFPERQSYLVLQEMHSRRHSLLHTDLSHLIQSYS